MPTLSLCHPRHRPGARAVAVAVIALVAAGCGAKVAILQVQHAQELRQAQAQFNETATLENQLKLHPFSADAVTTQVQINTSYRTVLATISGLIENKKAELQADQLLGAAYIIKALTELRLGDYSAAASTTALLDDSSIKLFPRDQALARAFRGLIKNDQALAHMQGRSDTFANIKMLLTEAVQNIADGIKAAPAANDIRTYLSVAQLAVMKNWIDLFNEARTYSSDGPTLDLNDETKQWCEAMQPVWKAFEAEIKRRGTDAAAAVQADWEKRLLLPDACAPFWQPQS